MTKKIEKKNIIHRLLGLTVKSIDEEKRMLTGIASSETVDRYGDKIQQDGWTLKNFWNNPVMPWNHDYNTPPVATIEKLWVDEGKLMFSARFAKKESYPFADVIFQLFKEGILKAFSVGFQPLEKMENDDGGYTFIKAELLEISAVTIPANPEAVSLAMTKGICTEDEVKKVFSEQAKDIEEDEEEIKDDKEKDTAKIKFLLNLLSEKHEEIKAYRKWFVEISNIMNIERDADELKSIESIGTMAISVLSQRKTISPEKSEEKEKISNVRTTKDTARTALTPECAETIAKEVAKQFLSPKSN